MSRIITVGAAQLGPIQRAHSRADVVERLLILLRQAARHGCMLVVFPELALTTFFPRWFMADQAEIDGFFETEMAPANSTVSIVRSIFQGMPSMSRGARFNIWRSAISSSAIDRGRCGRLLAVIWAWRSVTIGVGRKPTASWVCRRSKWSCSATTRRGTIRQRPTTIGCPNSTINCACKAVPMPTEPGSSGSPNAASRKAAK